MSFLRTQKNYNSGTTKNNKKTSSGAKRLQQWTFTLDELPKSLEEIKALDINDLKQPQNTAALTLLALCIYPQDRDECFRIIDYLDGPKPLSEYEKKAFDERFRGDQAKIPFSYFKGATPSNNYTPNRPFEFTVKESTTSRSNLNLGYITLFLESSGADSSRYVTLRVRESSGEWFLYEQFLLGSIKTPRESDPWA